MTIEENFDKEIKGTDQDSNIWRLFMKKVNTHRFELWFAFNDHLIRLRSIQQKKTAQDIWALLEAHQRKNKGITAKTMEAVSKHLPKKSRPIPRKKGVTK